MEKLVAKMKKFILIFFCFLPYTLIAQEEDLAEKAKIFAMDAEANGWKAHAGSPSVYEQFYTAFAYDAYNESSDPLQKLYIGEDDSYLGIISVLQEYAELDIQDWWSEYVKSFKINQSGLQVLVIKAKLTYPEATYFVLYEEYEGKEPLFTIQVDSINENFKVNYQSIIIPFVKLYRKKDNRRQELLMVSFTDEFLANRRIPVPVFDNYGNCGDIGVNDISEARKQSNDSFESLAKNVQSVEILNYKVKSVESAMQMNADYRSEKHLQGYLKEDRIMLMVSAVYKLDE